ncbi:hypothetical protein Ahy_A07g033436 isoform A [Arachis hypogaea]|uniref:Uncharacterized protein n=1 Tax=Arachis hypogaea TaxID=3818 RepID=A0A445C9D9_ARAHY|nr:hypothetical protein Ahy_A07g033436 isoform A [Arachis hypogaea]
MTRNPKKQEKSKAKPQKQWIRDTTSRERKRERVASFSRNQEFGFDILQQKWKTFCGVCDSCAVGML